MNELDKCDPTKINILGINFLKWINIGLKNYLLGFRDRGHALGNIVYFELLSLKSILLPKRQMKNFILNFRNYGKWICKRKRGKTITKKIKNNYKKIVISLDKAIDDDFDGIESIYVIKWLLK